MAIALTALLAPHTAAWAQTRAAATSLPIGFPITIVADETVDSRVRAGSEFRAHLRDPIELGTTLVAPAGTQARLIVIGKEAGTNATPQYRIAITDLNLGLAGTLPVRPDAPTVVRITAGLAIPATTLAAIGYQEGKIRVVVPLPFTLSNDPPTSGYSPAPLRTAAPILSQPHPRRRSDASPSPSSSPGSTARPDAGPYPTGTNPPPGTPVFPSPSPPGVPTSSTPTPYPLPT